VKATQQKMIDQAWAYARNKGASAARRQLKSQDKVGAETRYQINRLIDGEAARGN